MPPASIHIMLIMARIHAYASASRKVSALVDTMLSLGLPHMHFLGLVPPASIHIMLFIACSRARRFKSWSQLILCTAVMLSHGDVIHDDHSSVTRMAILIGAEDSATCRSDHDRAPNGLSGECGPV